MKTLLLLLVLFLSLISCDKSCKEDEEKLAIQYQQALQNAGGNEAAANEVTRQYNEKRANLDCD